MSSVSTSFIILKQELTRRICEEGIVRLKKCLNLLSEDQIWERPNNNSNSVGNLILHLNGNVNQWFISTFSNEKDTRQRSLEFNQEQKKLKTELLSILAELNVKIQLVSKSLTESQVDQKYKVQCYEEYGAAIIIHVIEHFSYHVGQVTFYTKLMKNIDTKYYDGAQLDQINND